MTKTAETKAIIWRFVGTFLILTLSLVPTAQIYAEVNSLGTPILAHDKGLASEVLYDSNPVSDCTDCELIIDILRN